MPVDTNSALGAKTPAMPLVALCAGASGAVFAESGGGIKAVSLAAAAGRARSGLPLLVCHAPALARRLGCDPFPALDLLELFAFVRPAQFCLPTPGGLATVLGLDAPGASLTAQAALLHGARDILLAALADFDGVARVRAAAIATTMAAGGWPWAAAVLAALASPNSVHPAAAEALAVWRDLEEWEERPAEPPSGHEAVSALEARARLAELLGGDAEARPQQADFASAVSTAFAPREQEDEPRLVLAEAGTGVGKTLGYIAPASVWAEKNRGTVWISTFTRNLQHQIDGELDRLFPDPAIKAQRVVLRKGRENYLCLLNFEEAVRAVAVRSQDAIALGLMARWVQASRDGDMTGGDFPAWLVDLLGYGRTLGLTDRRGECVYSACPHFRTCFIEKTVRRARRAEIVIANHALVMVQAAFRGLDDAFLPARYVFDEGHHIFNAADAAFSGHLTGSEMADLRRWLRGAEGRSRSRARGLKRRLEELVASDEAAVADIDAALQAAAALPGEGWHGRIGGDGAHGEAEAFLAVVRGQVAARAADAHNGFGLEADCRPPVPGLIDAGAALAAALDRLRRPLAALAKRLRGRLDAEAADLDRDTRLKIEAMARSLTRRLDGQIEGWRAMLKALAGTPPDEFVDWLAIERRDGRDVDVGMHRHWIDPSQPFAETVAAPAQGVLVTSATLRNGTGDMEADWQAAERRVGAVHLAGAAVRAAVPSPFDYAACTRVFVVNDVARTDTAQIAAAYRELFLAAGGGGLGLFTAIGRLRAVHARLAPALDAAGLPLYAQHVDGLDTNTLIEIFRAERDSCLLGTDAVRDGVDVPGRSLRLIVFDRVPWPRPDILHRARKARFGGAAYDDMLTRLRLKQAYGRLIRRADDHGVFVMLDRQMPSRLAGAFPEGVTVERLGLAEVVAATAAFLRPPSGGEKP